MIGIHLYSQEEVISEIKEIGFKDDNRDIVDLAESLDRNSIYKVTENKIVNIAMGLWEYKTLTTDERFDKAKGYIDTLIEIGLIDEKTYNQLYVCCEYVLEWGE